MRLRLIEPEVQPARIEVSVEIGEPVRVYALAPKLSWAGLRATVVRTGAHQPPPDSVFVGTVSIREDFNGDHRVHLESVGAMVEVHHELDYGRTAARAPEVLEPDGWMSLMLPDLRTIRVALRLVLETVQGADATVGGSGTRRSKVVRGESGIAWLVPTIWTVFTDQQQFVMSNIRALGKRLGIGPQTMQSVFVFAGFAAAAGYGIWSQRSARADAEAAAQASQADAARANDAMQAALSAEQTCLTERRDIAAKLGLESEARLLRAEVALQQSEAEAIARDLGGPRYSDEQLLERSGLVSKGLREAVAVRMEALKIKPKSIKPCLTEASKWTEDLPRYAALWHPDAEQICPPGYMGFENNLTLLGRWGLSTRVVMQYGVQLPNGMKVQTNTADLEDDPRQNDRWSAATLAEALRETQATVLTGGEARRATVWPEEAQLWSLALFAATNRLARIAEGKLDSEHRVCLDAAIRSIVEQRGVLAPG
ncbi:MAG: hypothetical protein CL927_10075, partial [Deltaproteobacteria bacterium]|nr:hypothetical protein [Deltaproteobacteria bacterium]